MGRWILSWLATVLGILQVVKLALMRGVPGTQTFGALYVVSYCLQAGINQWGRPEEAHEAAPLSRLESGHLEAQARSNPAQMKPTVLHGF
jgi:hypothetical protein